MRELEKITINGVRYIIWDEARGGCPDASGIRLLLSARDGVGADILLALPKDHPLADCAYASDGIGADILLALPKNHPLAVCAYASDGHKTSVSDDARHAVSISLEKSAAPISEAKFFHIKKPVDYVEVRLTDSFCARLFATAGRNSRLAG